MFLALRMTFRITQMTIFIEMSNAQQQRKIIKPNLSYEYLNKLVVKKINMNKINQPKTNESSF